MLCSHDQSARRAVLCVVRYRRDSDVLDNSHFLTEHRDGATGTIMIEELRNHSTHRKVFCIDNDANAGGA